MANSGVQDVIELGSSDEDTEPVPKKKKLLSIPMVQIPKELPGITIKPARPKVNPISSSIGKGVTVTKVPSGCSKVANPFAKKSKLNGKPIPSKPPYLKPVIPATNPSLEILPFAKIRGLTTPRLGPLKMAKGIMTSSSISSRPLPSRLPPGITVKRTKQTINNHSEKKIQPQRRKFPLVPKSSKPPEMVCVDLDDDDPPPSSDGPQWYLKPEDPEDKNDSKEKTDLGDSAETETSTKEEMTITESSETDIEKQNNKEPIPIEITIEDSPSKPPKRKRHHDVNELTITIEDSPAKIATDKPASNNSSDNEATTTGKDKQSKKKLEYPGTPETVEMEVDNNNDNHNDETEVVEIEESPLKPFESENSSTPKKMKPNPQVLLKLNVTKTTPMKSQTKVVESKAVTPPSDIEEFNPTYQSFIKICFQFDNSDDMSKIIEKKIKLFYRQVPSEYTESEAFIDLVESKISAIKAAPDKMYTYIKDVVDELSMQKKMAKAQVPKLDVVNEEKKKILYGDESEFDLKRQRQIRKLEKTIKKLHRAIQKLEEQEVDFDDEEDSVYLLTESEDGTNQDNKQPLDKSELLKRYKERLIRVHAKFCQLTNTKMPSEPRVHLESRPGQPKGAAKRLEKWINKKVPIGAPLPFPDFHDVLRCVREANQEDKLGWNEADIMEEARDLFTRCGKKLQRRRQENEWRLAVFRIQSEVDPAEGSEELKSKLDQNRRVASVKESEVLNKFADRQNQLKLEAVEIGDKEANESPLETDEDEPTEQKTFLETKEKRTKRLKRLIQENSKKPVVEKDPSEESEKAIIESHEENDPINTEHNKTKSDTEKIHSLSDDSSKIDSDIDELHLLQKLHSDVVDSSTLESSDNDSQIDTLSSSDSKKRDSDVISIENSSYSESEKNNEPEIELVSYSQKNVISETVDTEMEIECSIAGVQKKINKSNNDECNESVEDILLASSDDEADKDNRNIPISVSKINLDLTENKETECLREANSMDGTEMKAGNNDNLNENMEITSISSIENGNDNIAITDEAICVIDSVESAQSIHVKPTENDINEINSPESKENSVKSESEATLGTTEDVHSAAKSIESIGVEPIKNDLNEIVSSNESTVGEATVGFTPDKDTTGEVHRVKLIQSVNVKKSKNDSNEIDSTENNKISVKSVGEATVDSKPVKDTTEEVHCAAKSIQSIDVEPTKNDSNEIDSSKATEISIKSVDEASMSSKLENNITEEVSSVAKTREENKTSSNEGKNEKSSNKNEMESSSNNDEQETCNINDDNINEFSMQGDKVDDSDAKAIPKRVASVESMEVDISMDTT